MDLQSIITPLSTALLSFTELCIEFPLIVWLSTCNFSVLFHSGRSHCVILKNSGQLVSDKKTPAQLQMANRYGVSNELVNTIEHLTAKEVNIPFFSVGGGDQK